MKQQSDNQRNIPGNDHKQDRAVIKLVMWLFFAGIIAYFALYAFHVLFRSYETAALYSYSAEDLIQANGYLFREEVVLEDSTALEEVIPGEGEMVGVGDTLAVRYADQKALERSVELSELERRLESLEYILSHASDGSDNATLNQSIVDALTQLRQMGESGELSELGEVSSRLKNLMFRRDYTYNGSSALSKEIKEVSKEIKELKKKNKNSTEEIRARESGVFSGIVDGYENILTPDKTAHLSVSDLRELVRAPEEVGREPLGKLITGSRWYCAAEVAASDAQKLYEGGTATVRFSGYDWQLPMRVESISKEEMGVVCVVLSSDRYLSSLTGLRSQPIDIIFNTTTGYRVDKRAIYVNAETGRTGVYRHYGTRAAWVNVDLLWEGEDYYLVRQSPEYDEEGNEVSLTTLQKAKQLRAGAEIIVAGRELYDGKVIE